MHEGSKESNFIWKSLIQFLLKQYSSPSITTGTYSSIPTFKIGFVVDNVNNVVSVHAGGNANGRGKDGLGNLASQV